MGFESGFEVGGGECGVCAKDVDETAIFAFHVNDEGLAGGEVAGEREGGGVDASVGEGFGDEATEDVVADLAAKVGLVAGLTEGDGDVGGKSADIEDQVVGHDELTGSRTMVQRRAQVVGHQNPGADDLISR